MLPVVRTRRVESERSRRNEDRELCEIAREYGGEGDCVAAAAYDITANFTSAEKARALCDAVHSGVRGRCYYGLGIVMARFRMTDEARVADCKALAREPALVAECLRGGRENLPNA